MIEMDKPANFKVNATLNHNGKCYEHFGIQPELAMLYGNKLEDIVEVEMKVSDDQIIISEITASADYWGWYNNNRKEFTNMIYAQRFLLEMCFTYGIKASEESGEGKAYRLEIVSVRNLVEKS